jgi:hypothetical protein
MGGEVLQKLLRLLQFAILGLFSPQDTLFVRFRFLDVYFITRLGI